MERWMPATLLAFHTHNELHNMFPGEIMILSVPKDHQAARQPSDEFHFSLLGRFSVQHPDDAPVELHQIVKAKVSWNV